MFSITEMKTSDWPEPRGSRCRGRGHGQKRKAESESGGRKQPPITQPKPRDEEGTTNRTNDANGSPSSNLKNEEEQEETAKQSRNQIQRTTDHTNDHGLTKRKPQMDANERKSFRAIRSLSVIRGFSGTEVICTPVQDPIKPQSTQRGRAATKTTQEEPRIKRMAQRAEKSLTAKARRTQSHQGNRDDFLRALRVFAVNSVLHSFVAL